eukprot:1425600-Lingulodinium_polyedra.AAC.1
MSRRGAPPAVGPPAQQQQPRRSTPGRSLPSPGCRRAISWQGPAGMQMPRPGRMPRTTRASPA